MENEMENDMETGFLGHLLGLQIVCPLEPPSKLLVSPVIYAL